ncbi:MAG: hypothetical protein AVDCRST_MAG11-1580, partial [uncultured Gemmatimonadaceae bacterium]
GQQHPASELDRAGRPRGARVAPRGDPEGREDQRVRQDGARRGLGPGGARGALAGGLRPDDGADRDVGAAVRAAAREPRGRVLQDGAQRGRRRAAGRHGHDQPAGGRVRADPHRARRERRGARDAAPDPRPRGRARQPASRRAHDERREPAHWGRLRFHRRPQPDDEQRALPAGDEQPAVRARRDAGVRGHGRARVQGAGPEPAAHHHPADRAADPLDGGAPRRAHPPHPPHAQPDGGHHPPERDDPRRRCGRGRRAGLDLHQRGRGAGGVAHGGDHRLRGHLRRRDERGEHHPGRRERGAVQQRERGHPGVRRAAHARRGHGDRAAVHRGGRPDGV